jgi:hypothetical protein
VLGTVALGVAACSGTSSDAILDDAARENPTLAPPSSTGPTFSVIRASVDASVSTELRVFVNGAEVPVVLAPDGTFALQRVPVGHVAIECVAGSARGGLVVEGVLSGETLVISVRRVGLVLVCELVARVPPAEPPHDVGPSGGPLVIVTSNTCYALPPGDTRRDVVVRGDHVTLVGAPCDGEARSTLTGNVTVAGDDCAIIDVTIAGRLTIGGKRAWIHDGCSGCFNETCGGDHERDKRGGKHGGKRSGQRQGGQGDERSGNDHDDGEPDDD